MQNLYRIALACGAVPLMVGIFFYLFWLVTRWDVLRSTAPTVILISIMMVFAGCLALGRFAWMALRRTDVQRDQAWKAIIIAGTVLSLNLPVTAGLLGQIVAKPAARAVTGSL